MGKVRVLPSELVNQIAAGEVVERPASVVKELVENALDAHATQIRVAIREGGMAAISVSDDGTGMGPEDARLAFERHATSKLESAEDLARVSSLGFRGEALPSIASVAAVRMRTRQREDAIGTELEGFGAGIERSAPVACAEGTTIEVLELFGRVPARRKFLKSAVTEASHVVRWLERIALARPDVRFELERDGRRALLWLPTRDARERVLAVLPPGAGEDLRPVGGETPTLRVTGFASPTHVLRSGPSDLHVYVNGRPVRDRLLQFAVRDAYRDALPPGRYPVVVLFLQVDPGEVDVNVHPAKWEVRFRDPAAVTALLRRAIGAAVRVGTSAALEYRLAPLAQGGGGAVAAGDFDLSAGLFAPTPPGVAESADSRPTAASPGLSFARLRYVGQALGLYLVLEGESGLVLIDQHAAHERVLFERLRRAVLEDKLERQPLLVPLELELSRADAEILDANAELLARAGIELETGAATLRGTVRASLRSLPALLAGRRGASWPEMLAETARALAEPGPRESRDGLERALHELLASSACHAAVRKGDRLDPREAGALLEALDDTLWFPNCPHGRPILATLDRAELERRFLRR
ncbi:MAG: DNA mismatch repair endonuclease MutL [Deltaproteobacteria bacterium]|nr:DNA mismatch repair endonuclease MutL [Deltaproteobacteria bacterium]